MAGSISMRYKGDSIRVVYRKYVLYKTPYIDIKIKDQMFAVDLYNDIKALKEEKRRKGEIFKFAEKAVHGYLKEALK